MEGKRSTRLQSTGGLVGAGRFERPTPCAQGMGVVSNSSIIYYPVFIVSNKIGNLLFARKLTLTVSTGRVLAQFCHSSVAVSLTGNLPEDRHFASQNTIHVARLQHFGSGACR